jgi:hypothetical protein
LLFDREEKLARTTLQAGDRIVDWILVQASSTFGQMVGLHFSHDRAVVLGAFTSPQRYAAERCRDVHKLFRISLNAIRLSPWPGVRERRPSTVERAIPAHG